MKKIRANLLILVIFLPALAQAELLAICQMTYSSIDPEWGPSYRQEFEILEKPLKFSRTKGSDFAANLTFEFKFTPGYATTLQIVEKEVKGRVVLNSTLVTRKKSNAKVVARGFTEHEIIFPGRDAPAAEIFCNAYDRTISLQPTEEPVSSRERMRLRHFNAPAYRREYVSTAKNFSGLYEVDFLDLWRQLLKIQSLEADFLRQTVKDLEGLKFQESGLDSFGGMASVFGEFSLADTKSSCDPGSSGYQCEVEKFWVTHVFVRPVFEQEPRVHVRVDGRLFRDSKTRAIRGYALDRVVTHSPTQGPAGGGSSTSGGRITKGN